MTRLNAGFKDSQRRARAIAIEQGVERQSFRIRKAMILFALIMLAAAMATHAFAAGSIGSIGSVSGGFHGGHVRSGFHGSIIDLAPSMPAPTFNPSVPYTVPQSSETPVSPASPGSVFGNG
jgi:hypothetical protein